MSRVIAWLFVLMPGLVQAQSFWPVVEKTAVCACQGSNKGVCFCLQKGLPCKCNHTTGSVWTLDERSKPVAKTDANPATGKPAPKPAVVIAPVIPVPTYRVECRNATQREPTETTDTDDRTPSCGSGG